MTIPHARSSRFAPLLALFPTVLLLSLTVSLAVSPTSAAPAPAASRDSVTDAGLLGLPYAFNYNDQAVDIGGSMWSFSTIYPLGAPDNAIVAYIDVNVAISGPGADRNSVRYCPANADLSECIAVANGNSYHLTDFAGRQVNQYWALRFAHNAQDGNASVLSYWSIRIYYTLPAGPQPTATATPTTLHSIDLYPIADTMTSDGNKNGAFGSALSLTAGYMHTLRTWYKFDVAGAHLPPDAYGIGAEMILYHESGGSVALDAFTPLGDWNEATLSWANQPAVDPHPIASRWVGGQPPKFERWNVSGVLEQWLHGDRPNYGLMLTDVNDARSAVFASRETKDIRHSPILRIYYFQPPATPPAATATPTISPTPTQTSTPLPYEQRVNAGGQNYTDAGGRLWTADKPYTAGSWGYVGGTSYVTTHAIAGTSDPALYQSERFWNASATPAYRFTLPPGWYEVTLKFAEIYRNSAQTRVFGFAAEGVPVLATYDPFKAAGGKNIAAPDVTFVVPVSDGILDIDVTRYAAYDGPKISAIAVLSMGSSAATFTPTPTSTAAAPTATPTVTPTSAPYERRVNAGGPAYTDTMGKLWAADKAYAPGDWGYNGGFSYTTNREIANTNDDMLYQSERFWGQSAQPGYVFTVPDGRYLVTLKFAEIYRNSPFTRRFGVNVEGIPILALYDPWMVAGGRYIAAPDVTTLVTVSDGHIIIDFTAMAGYDGPKISAIAVVQQ